MKCSKARDRLMDYAAAELPPGEAEELRSHLETCEACAAALASARQASQALMLLREGETAPDMVSAVRERIALGRPLQRPVLLPRLAAAFSILLACALAAGWFWTRPVVHRDVPVVTTQKETQSPAPEPPLALKQTPTPEAVAEPDRALRQQAVHKPVVVAPRDRKSVKPARPEKAVPPPEEPVLVQEPTEDAQVEIATELDSDEPEMLFVLRPREPESYTIQVDAEEESPASELSIVREFNIGGEVTSVTIDQKDMPDIPELDTPDSGATRFMDVAPADTIETGSLGLGGYTDYA